MKSFTSTSQTYKVAPSWWIHEKMQCYERRGGYLQCLSLARWSSEPKNEFFLAPKACGTQNVSIKKKKCRFGSEFSEISQFPFGCFWGTCLWELARVAHLLPAEGDMWSPGNYNRVWCNAQTPDWSGQVEPGHWLGHPNSPECTFSHY